MGWDIEVLGTPHSIRDLTSDSEDSGSSFFFLSCRAFEVAAESIPAEESHEKEIRHDSSGLAIGAFLNLLICSLGSE